MRSNRKILTGGLILAGVAIFSVLYLTLSNIRGRLAASRDAAPVVRPVSTTRGGEGNSGNGTIYEAAVNIPSGSIITREMLRAKSYQGPTSEPFITNPESQALGFITRVPIARGSQIRPDDDFIGHISETGIAGVLRPGTRAMVLPLTNKSTLHDLVRIGNSVDVLAAFDGQESRSIVQDVRVVAVDVFGNDFPQVNAAMRGAYKADARGRGIDSTPSAPGAAAAPAGPPSETATPAPAPTPAAGTPRPDASLTLEVTPEQAVRIQLAIASNAAMDFLVRPSLPGNRSIEPGSLVSGAGGEGSEGSGTTSPDGALLVRPVSVTKAQIAPYAERKKSASGSSNSSASSGSGGSSSGGSSNRSARNVSEGGFPIRVRQQNVPFPPISSIGSIAPVDPNVGRPIGGTPEFPRSGGGTPPGSFVSTPGNVTPSVPSTYKIPIYADGTVVRTETVQTPRE